MRRSALPLILGLGLLLACAGSGGSGPTAPEVQPAPPPPTLDSAMPSVALPGEWVTLKGTGFTPGSRVAFGGVPAAEVSFRSGTLVLAKVPGGAAAGPITLTAEGGTARAPLDFTPLPPAPAPPDPPVPPSPPPPASPVITGFTPAAGYPGRDVTLEGTGLSGAAQVIFGGEATALPQGPSTDGQVRVLVPAEAASGPISVVTPSGTGTSAGSFTVLRIPDPPPVVPVPPTDPPRPPEPLQAPTVTGVSPEAEWPFRKILVTGKGFSTVTRVEVAGRPAPLFEAERDDALRVTVPDGPGEGTITVFNAAGAGQLPPGGTFTILQPPPPPPAADPPVITAVDKPAARPGEVLSLQGTALASTVAVTLGTAAAAFEYQPDGSLQVTVPPRPVSDLGPDAQPITVRTLFGSTTSPIPFQFLPAGPPAILSFSPTLVREGDAVTVTGQHFRGLQRVLVGDTPCLAPELVDDGQIRFQVPLGASTGLITVITRTETGASDTLLSIRPPAFTLAALHPAQGGPGTRVILKGTDFPADSRVLFGTVPLLTELVNPGELVASIPSNAAAGLASLRVASASQRGSLSRPFQVTAGAPGQATFLEGWHLTQGVQDFKGSVPLVAGRRGLLRVFLRSNRPGAASPDLVAILRTPGAPDRIFPAPAASGPVPGTAVEGDLANSRNLPIPGDAIQPGTSLILQIDPTGRTPGADTTGNGILRPLGAVRVRPIAITLVPIRSSTGAVGDVAVPPRAVADWADYFGKLFPVSDAPGQFSVAVDAPALVDADFTAGGDPLEDHQTELYEALAARRPAASDADTLYYGVVPYPVGGLVTLGLNWGPETGLAAGTDDERYAFRTFVHELAHTYGLGHAPANVAEAPPGWWPNDPAHADGLIGAYGWDRTRGQLVNPAHAYDIMGYSFGNEWISDFCYTWFLDRIRVP